ncbi:MAG: 1-deoxy-D-xylulose 5-phosphate reductoisomerase [Chlamydiia bacterium]|nr:1-deoxy-D-xylulose 5-phosphate reductoisomerase [Chlamydiia bacterium]MCH9618686.1 1-deoxy-D-xylulose 5-phosphate reductoisomerase [Chlamydiia bacterium]MCH9624411.1 1-deoxy-D-xylulose 5-phosphate reductoisomerase [Chlamydiia bacterium]
MKNIAILGSTGEVGRKTLEVIKSFPDEMSVFALTCKQSTQLLKEQIKEFTPKMVSIACPLKAKEFKHRATVQEIVTHPDVDVVVFAMDGTEAVEVAFLAAGAGKDIALANKEILVCAGEAFMTLCREKEVNLFPVDSEHCAIEECLLGEDLKEVDKIILTASGGPFLKREDYENFSFKEATMHPTYACGNKVAVNCSTMMNKGLEIIEAVHLFGIGREKIDVVIHPQSIVQSMVSFADGSVKAMLARPNIIHSIQYALLGRKRKKGIIPPFHFNDMMKLEFFPKDKVKFRCLALAYAVIEEGGAYPSFLNAANEVLVERFYKGEVSWKGIGETLEELINNNPISKVSSLESVLDADKRARRAARDILPR